MMRTAYKQSNTRREGPTLIGNDRQPRVSTVRRGALAVAAAGALTSVVAAATPSFALGAPAAPATPAPNYRGFETVLKHVLAQGAPGTWGQVDDARSGIHTVSLGKADLPGRSAPNPEGEFRVGSITKTFTSVLVLQLAAEHRVSLDTPAADYLPAGTLPASWHITVRQLLHHTSGLYDYTNDLLAGSTVPDFEQIRYKQYKPADLVAMAVRHGLQATPGSAYAYSNTNFVVLGMLIEHVTGKSYPTVLDQRIITPLRLRHTEFVVPRTTIDGPHAEGYLTPDDRSQPLFDATRQTASWIWTAGAVISNAEDLDSFLRALVTGRVLPPKQLKEMETMEAVNAGGTSSYGLGLREYKLSCGIKVVGHDGILEGYQSYAYTTLDGSRQVTFSANASNNSAVFQAEHKALDPVFCGTAAPASDTVTGDDQPAQHDSAEAATVFSEERNG
jgi:D-alanyl-D-alanine carboxypeptidase